MRKVFDKVSSLYLALGGDIRTAHKIEDFGRDVASFWKENKQFIFTFIEALIFFASMYFFYVFGILLLEVLLGVK